MLGGLCLVRAESGELPWVNISLGYPLTAAFAHLAGWMPLEEGSAHKQRTIHTHTYGCSLITTP